MRPRVIVNCAMSADGKIALPARVQTPISNEEDLRRVRRLRAEADAILVGIGTVLADDPRLTVNDSQGNAGRPPLRVVLDSNGRTPPDARVLDGSAPTLIVTNTLCRSDFGGAETMRFGGDRVDLPALMKALFGRGVRTVLVEGGGEVIWSFLEANLVDRMTVFVGPTAIGGKTSPTPADGKGAEAIEEMVPMRLVRLEQLGDGALMEYAVE